MGRRQKRETSHAQSIEFQGFSDWEIEVVRALIKFKTYARAARFLTKKPGITFLRSRLRGSRKKWVVTPGALRQVTYTLRLRRERVGEFIKQYEQFRRQLGPAPNYLTERKKKIKMFDKSKFEGEAEELNAGVVQRKK